MDETLYLLIGSYTPENDKGLYVCRFNQKTGDSEFVSMIEVSNPSYLIVDKSEKFVYAVSENPEGPSYVNAFIFDKKNGQLTQIDSVVSGDESSCYITADGNSKHILTANYGGGSVSVFDADTDGMLYQLSQLIVFDGKGVDPERQTKPHIHCVEFSPDAKYLFATDLGTDKIHRMKVNYSDEGDFINSGTIEFFKVADGSGPRHIVFHPSGRYMYLMNELSGTVISFLYEDGNLTEFQQKKADMNDARGGGDIVVSPNGKFLYASVRLKDDGIAIFTVDHSNGELTQIGYQHTAVHPRSLSITPNGRYLLASCRDAGVIEIYEINQDTGTLKNIHKNIEIDMPACMKFVHNKER